jgi:enoyl-[acyl-carrier protein] reductase/trans-2-enoyl-CoA reductase (NAD+)
MYRPRIKNNICTNAHPVGCFYSVYDQMLDALNTPIKTGKNQTALVIGASSGLGLASRLALAFSAGMDTIGVYSERAAQAHKYGSAGWYNNQAFEYYARRANKMALSTNQDAFQKNAKDWVIQKLQQNDKKIDVLVYSLAAPKRNVKGVAEYVSAIKPIDENFKGHTLDIFEETLRECDIETANQDEVDATVKVMGGEDWQEWVLRLKKAGVLADNFKTVAYSYMGPEHTQSIYSQGTLGCAKTHLHETAIALDNALVEMGGQASIGVLQALVTPSSSAIPGMPLYMSVLAQQQKKLGKYENTLQQVNRLFKDGLFNKSRKPEQYLRVDDLECNANVQKAVQAVYGELNQTNFCDLVDIKNFKQNFLQQFGFAYDFINYEQKPDPLTPPAIHDFSDLSYRKAG